MVDLDPQALYANHLSATDISNALKRAKSDPASRNRQGGRP